MKRLLTCLCLTALLLTGCVAETAPDPIPSEKEDTTQKDVPVVTQNPVATIVLEDEQVIRAELYPTEAPNTVYNFIALANSGFYDGVVFHRAMADVFVQGGDPTGTGFGGPDYAISGEFTENGVKNNISHRAGVLSMARANDPNSAGSQFFIMAGDYPGFDGRYAAFGKVTEGLDIVIGLSHQQTDENDLFLSPPVMKEIRVETFGVAYPAPKTHTK